MLLQKAVVGGFTGRLAPERERLSLSAALPFNYLTHSPI